MKTNNSSLRTSRRRFLRAGVGGGAGLLAAPLGAFGSASPKAPAAVTKPTGHQSSSPPWTKDLIIYELGTTQGFTSPKGPGTGTFGSMTPKLAYLQELGITGIWMDPPSLQDSVRFFYNMWNRYGVMEPDKFDPVLGTEEELKALVEEAHRRGVRIFPDIKTHGVMKFSPLVKKHPEWFRGSHWNMADYDWYGGHTDLDNWWVKIWTDSFLKYKFDGTRLDVNIYRPDLWKRIRENVAAAGHPMIIWEEDNTGLPGVVDFSQHENGIFDYEALQENAVLARDIPGFYERKFGKVGPYRVLIQYADGTRDEGSTDGQGALRVHLDGITDDKAPRRKQWGSWYMPDGIPDVQLTVENVAAKPIENVTVRDDVLGPWQLNTDSGRYLAMEGDPPSVKLYIATIAHGWPTIQISCHDQGWDGFPLDKNPYTAQGSRALMGYSGMFTPMIPIFFSGEEFNATYQCVPLASPHLYGGKDPGKCRWLYAAMLDWEELKQPDHHAMFEDVKKMITIRKREGSILSVLPDKEKPKLMAVPVESEIKVPVPYIRWNDRSAILVTANRDTDKDANLRLEIPLRAIGLAGRANYNVTDLWPGGEAKTYSENDLAAFTCTVQRDKTQGGGLRVFKIEPSAG